MVTNYQALVSMEEKITALKKKQNGDNGSNTDISDGSKTDVTGKTGTPVYYVSNLHARQGFLSGQPERKLSA